MFPERLFASSTLCLAVCISELLFVNYNCLHSHRLHYIIMFCKSALSSNFAAHSISDFDQVKEEA